MKMTNNFTEKDLPLKNAASQSDGLNCNRCDPLEDARNFLRERGQLRVQNCKTSTYRIR